MELFVGMLLLKQLLYKDNDLASSPTLCRFENRADRSVALALHEVLIKQFISSL
jgi:hypothetical protein